MRRQNLTEIQKEAIFLMWQDRVPIKVIAITFGKTYACIHQYLRKRCLVG